MIMMMMMLIKMNHLRCSTADTDGDNVLLITRHSVAKQLGFIGDWTTLWEIRDQTGHSRVRGCTWQHEEIRRRKLHSACLQGAQKIIIVYYATRAAHGNSYIQTYSKIIKHKRWKWLKVNTVLKTCPYCIFHHTFTILCCIQTIFWC